LLQTQFHEQSAILMHNTAILLRKTEILLRRIAKLLRKTAKLLRRIAKLLRRIAKLLRKTAILLRRIAKLLRRIAKLLRKTAILLRRIAKLLRRIAKLLRKTAILLRKTPRFIMKFTNSVYWVYSISACRWVISAYSTVVSTCRVVISPCRVFRPTSSSSRFFLWLAPNDRGYGHLAVCGSIRCRETTRWMREQRPLNARQPANEHRRVLGAGLLVFSCLGSCFVVCSFKPSVVALNSFSLKTVINIKKSVVPIYYFSSGNFI